MDDAPAHCPLPSGFNPWVVPVLTKPRMFITDPEARSRNARRAADLGWAKRKANPKKLRCLWCGDSYLSTTNKRGYSKFCSTLCKDRAKYSKVKVRRAA